MTHEGAHLGAQFYLDESQVYVGISVSGSDGIHAGSSAVYGYDLDNNNTFWSAGITEGYQHGVRDGISVGHSFGMEISSARPYAESGTLTGVHFTHSLNISVDPKAMPRSRMQNSTASFLLYTRSESTWNDGKGSDATIVSTGGVAGAGDPEPQEDSDARCNNQFGPSGSPQVCQPK
jgi:hypothetical protein